MRAGGRGVRRGGVVLAVIGMLVLAVAACGGGASDRPVELTVYAAASLRDAVAAAAEAYETATPDTTVVVSTGSSAALRAQVELGAPADVFLAADTANPAALVATGRAIGPPTPFATNPVVLVTPADDPAGIATPIGLARPGVTIVAAGEAVPITRYADEVVARLATLDGYPADFAVRYAANVASREDDVGAVTTRVALGEADAAFVYATDARAERRLRTVPLPPEAAVAATYAGVVIDGSAEQPAAADFLAWLAGPDGRAILADAGFGPPP